MRILFHIALALVLVPVVAITIGALLAAGLCAVAGVRRHAGAPSDHFDGDRFFNPEPARLSGSGSILRWMLNRDRGPWRDLRGAPGTDYPSPPAQVAEDGLHITFINHSTVLLQLPGLTVLTDPVWARRASPAQWIGPKRMRDPGVRLDELPPIDIVLLSHNHYDHFDHATMAHLARSYAPRVLVPLGNAALLRRYGVPSAQELDWWSGVDVAPGIRITAVPARHFSGRATCDRNRALWCGYVISAPGGPIYFAGDTGFGSHFREIRERFGPMRLALLPIGAFRPRWFMAPVHISPDEAVEAHQLVESLASVAIHFGTFPLADDGQDEPVDDLRAALAKAPRAPPFWVLGFGEGRDVPSLGAPHPQAATD